MSYIELFSDYARGKEPASGAEGRIGEEYARLLGEGKVSEATRAQLCLTFFTRYRQYNSGAISRQDLLLFLRDFILFVGRFPMPAPVEAIIRQSGTEYGLSIAADGCADAADILPEWFPNPDFVHQVYGLDDSGMERPAPAIGDGILRRHSRFAQYRSIEQKIAVHAAVDLPEDATLMVSLPTGGGKSLITQMVAAVSHGLTMVMVPTVALISDQYMQACSCMAEEFKEHIFCYRGDTGPREAEKMLGEIRSRKARLIFTSPEALLKNQALNQALRKAAQENYLCNVVIDEAHIVPDWGTYFRPDFQIFSVVLKELRELSGHSIRTYLLSATLSQDVVQVLFDLFGQEGKNVAYRCDTLRKEPRFVFSECRDYRLRESRGMELVKTLPKPLILYVIEPEEAERLKKKFVQQGHKNIQTFTGDTPKKQREHLLKAWKDNQIDVMIATSAFGMGVDKPNVRTIVHRCVPENLSRFYQEVGRSGRDGLPALSVLLPYMGKEGQKSDLDTAFGLVNKSILGVDKLLVRWYSMVQNPSTYLEGDRMIVDLSTVPTSFSPEDAQCAGVRNMMWNVNALLLLHREHYIDIQGARFIPEKNTYSFTCRLLDTETLMEEEKLRQALEPDRQREYDMRVYGYRQMADLVHKPRVRCWARRLTALFPLAEEFCGGCPVHPQKPENEDDAIKIREAFPLEWTAAAPRAPLQKLFGSLHDVVVPVENWNSVDRNELVRRANEWGIGCVVLPQVQGVTALCESMLLSADEFLVIAPLAPWLFQKGVLILFDEDAGRNNRLFQVSHTGAFSSIHKILLAREDMMIYSQMRPLNEFLDCNYGTLAQFQKE